MSAPQFYWHWANSTETTFTSAQQTYDEPVKSFVIEHNEGAVPTLVVEIRNPRIGLLNAGRKLFGWLSFSNGTTVTPLFFGYIDGIPDDFMADVIAVKFKAQPLNFIRQKQLVAETLKVAPEYDPVFFSLDKRDDPDAIREGWSGSYHIDRVTNAVSYSDWNVGEDGTVTFLSSDVSRASVKIQRLQAPLVAVAVRCSVSWTQAWTGFVDLGTETIWSYSGDGIISDWPKPEGQIGGGYSCAFAYASDALGVSWAFTASSSYSWQNASKYHSTGDTMSINQSETFPLCSGYTYLITQFNQPGIIDPYAMDAYGDPAPINQPATQKMTWTVVPLWQVNTCLVLRYDAARQRKETAYFVVNADVQQTTAFPLLTEDTDLITLDGGDVGLPLLNLLNWDSISGHAVALGQLIFPNDPNIPGQTSTQICTTAGAAGTVEPTFPNIAGVTTSDNSVVWTSLGQTTPSEAAPDWTLYQNVPLGQMILPRIPIFVEWATLALPGLITVPAVGPSINLYQIIEGSNGYFFECVLAGVGGFMEPAWNTTTGAITNDGSAQWKCLGNTLPNGVTYYICTQAGQTGETLPPFTFNVGDVISDGSAKWTCVGGASLPVGGAPGFTSASAYFPTDRGQQSLQHAICRARAKLRWRARALKVSADVPGVKALSLSCRMNAVIPDPRLPGGQAAGKIIAYRLSMRDGKFVANVTIGCTVGNATAVVAVAGTPEVDDGTVFAAGVEAYDGAYELLPSSSDVTYTPPKSGITDDGLSFPLSKNQIVISDQIMGSLAAQEAALAVSLSIASRAAYIQQQQNGTVMSSIAADEASLIASQFSVSTALKQNPIWRQLSLKPVDGGPYAAAYNIDCSVLSLPKTIDLASAT